MNEFVQNLNETIRHVTDNNGIVSEKLQVSATDKDSEMENTAAERSGCIDKSGAYCRSLIITMISAKELPG